MVGATAAYRPNLFNASLRLWQVAVSAAAPSLRFIEVINPSSLMAVAVPREKYLHAARTQSLGGSTSYVTTLA